MIYSIYYLIFQSGGLVAFLGRHKPTKNSPQRRDWLQPAAIFWAQNVICCCTQQPNMILKISGGPIARLAVFPPMLWACLPSATLHVNYKSWFQCRSYTVFMPGLGFLLFLKILKISGGPIPICLFAPQVVGLPTINLTT